MNRLGFRITVVGAVAQTIGLGVDAWMHVKDPTLAAREALLTFSNVGHVLLLGGMAFVIAGVVIATLGPRLARTPRPVRVGVPLVLAVVLGASSIAASNSGLAKPHEHDAAKGAGAGHSHAGGHGHGAEPEPVALKPAARAQLAGQLTAARNVAERYPTVKQAVADGYKAVTPYIPLIGAHYMKFLTVDGTFDIEQPEMLLYDGTRSSSRIVGLSYYALGDGEPDGFVGPNDRWHRHLGLCIDAENPFVLGDEQTTEAECRKRGGTKADGADGWMVHAWVVPGWESTQGVFSAENPQLL
jgi:hypothetical protein